jgi:serine phosphatase RsbU (regulator of sigma subunit)/HAMP domain-containing protein
MVAFTIVAVVLAVLAIGSVSVAGVYNLARSEDTARLNAYRDLLSDDIDTHVLLVARTIDAVGSLQVLKPDARESLSAALARVASDNAEYLDVLAVTDASGTVRAESRAAALPRTLADLPFFGEAATSERARFGWQTGTGAPRTGSLWVIRRLSGTTGGDLVLAGRVRVGFMDRLLDEIARATESRSAYIVGTDGALVDAGTTSSQYVPGRLVYAPSVPGGKSGAVSANDTRFGPMTGFYQDMDAAPELGWRIAVMESEGAAMMRVRQALLPAGAATVIAALLAVLSTMVFSRRLVAPLTAFERRAREIASGGYVRPMDLDRSDELGRLADAFNEMGVRLNSLQDVAGLLASASDPGDVLDAVLSAIGHLLATSDAAVLLVSPSAAELVLARGRGLREPGVTFSIPLSEPSPVTAAFREQRPVPFEGQQTRWAHSVFRLFDAPPDRSGVAVPLSVGNEVLGVVVAVAHGRHPLTQAQVDTLRAYSTQAAVAVRIARLFEHEQVSRREAEALREVAELIAGMHDLGDALDQVAAVAAGLLGMSDCGVALRDRSEFGLEPSDDPAREQALLDVWRRHRGGSSHTGSTYEPLVLRDRLDVEVADVHGAGGILLLVPLVRGGDVHGVLALTALAGEAAPGPRQVALAGTLGKEVSLALENAALLQEARTRAANLETVFRISQAVSSSLQINVVLNRVLDVVQKIFSADAVSLMSYDPAKRVIATQMARGVANREMLYLQVAPGQDVPGAVFASRAPEVHGDLSGLDTPLAHLATAQGLRSLIAVPLLARGRSIGVLSVYDHTPDAFSAEDMELLLTFASQAALAIDTAGLYGKEHHVASILQASILPEVLPAMPGLETGSFYLPAGIDAEIGGDYYDLFAASDGSVVVAIGDVCGKGVLAATKTSMIKFSLRGMVAAGAGPGEALTELNRLVSSSGDPADIVTAWVGFIGPDRRSLTYADGGHPPALLCRADRRRFERLGPTGPLLGAIPGAVFEQVVVELEPGDVLVTYTDGVTEARRGRAFFGEGRIRKAVRRSKTAQGVVEALLAAVGEFSSGVMRDDAAALVLRVEDEAPA